MEFWSFGVLEFWQLNSLRMRSVYYILESLCISKKPLHLSYKPNGLQVGLSGESYKPFGQRKQPFGERNT